ncbi:nucleoid-associated protein [Clostridium gasigenes]|uniref:nucleoid-associated protein n=1 Tax=Clostridium gasigenes TaxID=94869 RepID=UPI0016290921|nr:nucleoid-associated protein [Clostridium gasigenes]MBB6622056.1 nucleoid-associated protein [Clostridium gasigenes]
MEYINDINIQEAVIHVLDKGAEEPVLNEYRLDLTDTVYNFLYKAVNKALNDESLKYAKFKGERNLIEEVSQSYLLQEFSDIVEVSKSYAAVMFGHMKTNATIPSCDLVTISMITDQGPMIGILKLDHEKDFTHNIEFVEGKIGINIVQHLTSLSVNIKKAAFIKPRKVGQKVDLMVLDKTPAKTKEEYGVNYFTKNFLDCEVVANERDMTRTLMGVMENWVRRNEYDNAGRAIRFRDFIRNKLEEEEIINIVELSEEIFTKSQDQVEFTDMLSAYGLPEEVTLDKAYSEKKLSKVKLKIGNIDLQIPQGQYLDPAYFEIKNNGDGSINMIIKNIANYVEK